jgi:hypothetical protein
MLRKYVGETAVLLPADIPVEMRDAYTYSWAHKNVVFSTDYYAEFVFPSIGIYNFELTIVDKKTNLVSLEKQSVEAMLHYHKTASTGYFRLVTIWDMIDNLYRAPTYEIRGPISAYYINDAGYHLLSCGGFISPDEQITSFSWTENDTGGFHAVGSMAYARSRYDQKFAYTTPTLANGKVLIAGNTHDITAGKTSELFDPIAETWSNTGSMTTDRNKFCFPILMADGKVFVFGGCDSSNVYNVNYEIYDPDTGVWTNHITSGYLLSGDYGYIAPPILLPNGKIFILHPHENCCSIFDPTLSSFTKITKPSGNAISKDDTCMGLGPDNNIYLFGCDSAIQSTMYNYTTQTWTDLPDWGGVLDNDFVLNGITYNPDPSNIGITSGYTLDTYIPEYDEHVFSYHVVFLRFDIFRRIWKSYNTTFYQKMIYDNPYEVGYGIFPNRHVLTIWGSLLPGDLTDGIFIQSQVVKFDAPRDKGVPSVSSAILPYDFALTGRVEKLDCVTTFLIIALLILMLQMYTDISLGALQMMMTMKIQIMILFQHGHR